MAPLLRRPAFVRGVCGLLRLVRVSTWRSCVSERASVLDRRPSAAGPLAFL